MYLTCMIVEMVHASIDLYQKKRRQKRRCQYSFGKHKTYIEGVIQLFMCHFGELVVHILNCNEAEVRLSILNITDVVERMTRKHKSKRSCWVRQLLLERSSYSEYNHLVTSMRMRDHESFYTSFRMIPERFDELLGKVGPLISKKNTVFRLAITPHEKLAVTLRYLAHGDEQNMLALSYRLGQSTVCKAIKETLKALWDVLSPEFLRTPTVAEWKDIADGFRKAWGFPNCLGPIDGKHVRMQAAANSGSAFFNYKGYHSLVLMAICDAAYRFTIVEFGLPGRESDAGIFNNMMFGKDLMNRDIHLPDPAMLPGTDVVLPHVFISDDAFPLLHNMMKPYAGRFLSLEQNVFNYRLSRARRTIENAFGILAAQWRIYHRAIVASVDTVEAIMGAAVCLHNYLLAKNKEEALPYYMYCPEGFADEFNDGVLVRGFWRDCVAVNDALRDIRGQGKTQSTKRAKLIREAYKDYFNSEPGSLPWLYTSVTSGMLNKQPV